MIECLNYDRSDYAIYYNKDAEKSIRITKVRKSVFKEDFLQGKCLYRVPYATDTYITERFAEDCKRHGLIGLDI